MDNTEYQRRYQKKRKARAKAANLCVGCMENTPRNASTNWCVACSNRITARVKAWRRRPENREKLAAAQKRSIEHNRKRNFELRVEFIKAYGGKCHCCGETNPRFLTLEHVGGVRRWGKYKTGGMEYRRLRRLGWPREDIKLYCYNCNCGTKDNGGICPHTEGESNE